MNPKLKRVAALLVATAMVVTLAACKKKPAEEETPSEPERLKPSTWVNPLEPPARESEYQVEIPEENKTNMETENQKNADVVAWLQIPNTTVNEAVVQTTDNDFYYRRDIYKNYRWGGCLWMDYECDLKDGTKKDVPQNTIIYGHNLGNPQGVTDDPNGELFSQLFKFLDPEFAKANPYVYLTTPGEDLVYQIFAVFYTEAHMKPVEYIYPTFSNEEFMKLIEDVRARSVLDYKDVDVTVKDKILTLSTCTYKYGTYAANDQQRFVIMAKLVKDKNFAETANVEPVASPKQPTF